LKLEQEVGVAIFSSGLKLIPATSFSADIAFQFFSALKYSWRKMTQIWMDISGDFDKK
jgi:hypothetical protein